MSDNTTTTLPSIMTPPSRPSSSPTKENNHKKHHHVVSIPLVILSMFVGAMFVQYATMENNLNSPTGSCEPHQSVECSKKLAFLEKFYNDRRNGGRKKKAAPTSTLNNIWEPDATCLLEERFGGSSSKRHEGSGEDDGYHVCGVDYLASKTKSTPQSCLVYSIGNGKKKTTVGWETSVHTFLPNCEMHIFDPNIMAASDDATLHDWALGKEGQGVTIKTSQGQVKVTTAKSLETMMKELGHSNRTIDMLKVDCEGCEWDAMPKVFDAISRGKMKPMDQIQMKVHHRDDNDANVVSAMLESMDQAGYRTIHKELVVADNNNNVVVAVKVALVHQSWLRQVHQHFLC